MTTTASAAATIRSMYEAAVAGDHATFFGYIAEDFVLEEPPYLSYGRTYHGPEGFAELFAAALATGEFSRQPSTLRVDHPCVHHG